MRSSKPKRTKPKGDFVQLGLDFFEENQYIIPPLTSEEPMENELFDKLEEKISALVLRCAELKNENQALTEENQRLNSQYSQVRGRVDAILGKLDNL